jgi:hypothetical protein
MFFILFVYVFFTLTIGQKPVDTIFLSSYATRLHNFKVLAALYQGAIFYQNDIKHVNPDSKRADISC